MIKLLRQTVSLCNVCYREIPATIGVESGGPVQMVKTCPHHGTQTAMVERDPVFYTMVSGLRAPSIYSGYFVDVTRRCNLRCNPCYFALEGPESEMQEGGIAGEYSIESIVAECRTVQSHPYVLTGGEPTLREDLPQIIQAVQKVGPVELLSNGVKLSERKVYERVLPTITRDGVAMLNLSVHAKETQKWKELVGMLRSDGLKIISTLIVIDSMKEFVAALDLVKELADVSASFRIKAASRIWNEQRPASSADGEKIFVSDMLGWLDREGGYDIITTLHNKSVFLNVNWRGLFLMLVSWHDTANVDLLDIKCAPYYRARNGEVANMVTAMLINEGVQKGFLKGRRVQGIQ